MHQIRKCVMLTERFFTRNKQANFKTINMSYVDAEPKVHTIKNSSEILTLSFINRNYNNG
jgi:hypothetical protein